MNSITDHWQRALSLMDTSATLSASERDAWLADITEREPAVAPLLRKLLSAHRRVETNDILATLPRLQPSVDGQATRATGIVGAIIGPFELIEAVGHGGMGSVWRACYADGRVKRDVAVKLPASSHNPTAVARLRERFARERDFLAQLQHPNIARLYDTGVSEAGQPYLAMEFVSGQAIDTYCDQQRLPVAARLALFLQVVDAVGYAHQQLVLHRDLKPSNVLVDGNGQVRLLDFGIAKLLPAAEIDGNPPAHPATDLTELSGTALTLAYAAPEQINNGALSTATDVYALGVMLYRLLTDSAPYQPKRDTRGALEEAVLSAAPTAASARHVSDEALAARQTNAIALRKSLAGDLDTLLAKALKKRPTERYPTAAALAEDIRRHLSKQPILARADSSWYRIHRFITRNRAAVAASALGVAALTTTTGVAVWQASVATASAARANKEAARAATVQKFLAGIFSAADPEHSKGATVTALEILQRGREGAERELANDPQSLLQVLDQIGDIYYQLGLPEEVVITRRRQLVVAESVKSRDVNVLTDAQLKLGFALGESEVADNNVEALPLLESALAGGRQRASSDDRIALALAYIADRHRLELRPTPALQYSAESIKLADSLTTGPSRSLADVYAIAAVVNRDQGRTDEARQFFEKTGAVNRTGLGHTLIEQLDVSSHFAQLEFDESNYVAALQIAITGINAAQKLPGDIGANVAQLRRVAVLAAFFAGDLAQATRLSETLLTPEANAVDTLRSGPARLIRARLAWTGGKLTVAENELRLSEAALEKSPLWASRWALAQSELELRQSRPTAAYDRLATLLRKQQGKLGSDHAELAPTLDLSGVAAARIGHTEEARNFFARSCVLREKRRAENHPTRIRCEAYKVLIAADVTADQKQSALALLSSKGAAGRSDNLPLLASLIYVQQHLLRTRRAEFSASEFPILN